MKGGFVVLVYVVVCNLCLERMWCVCLVLWCIWLVSVVRLWNFFLLCSLVMNFILMWCLQRLFWKLNRCVFSSGFILFIVGWVLKLDIEGYGWLNMLCIQVVQMFDSVGVFGKCRLVVGKLRVWFNWWLCIIWLLIVQGWFSRLVVWLKLLVCSSWWMWVLEMCLLCRFIGLILLVLKLWLVFIVCSRVRLFLWWLLKQNFGLIQILCVFSCCISNCFMNVLVGIVVMCVLKCSRLILFMFSLCSIVILLWVRVSCGGGLFWVKYLCGNGLNVIVMVVMFIVCVCVIVWCISV